MEENVLLSRRAVLEAVLPRIAEKLRASHAFDQDAARQGQYEILAQVAGTIADILDRRHDVRYSQQQICLLPAYWLLKSLLAHRNCNLALVFPLHLRSNAVVPSTVVLVITTEPFASFRARKRRSCLDVVRLHSKDAVPSGSRTLSG